MSAERFDPDLLDRAGLRAGGQRRLRRLRYGDAWRDGLARLCDGLAHRGAA